jgi:hypothetical protein
MLSIHRKGLIGLFITAGRYCMTKTKHLKIKIICIFKQDAIFHTDMCTCNISFTVWHISGTSLRLETCCPTLVNLFEKWGHSLLLKFIPLPLNPPLSMDYVSFLCATPALLYTIYMRVYSLTDRREKNVHFGLP